MHELTNEMCIFSFSKLNDPVLNVNDGDEVKIETLDCFSCQIKTNDDKLETMDWDKVNPATGPIFVNGAKENDTLEVTIKKSTLMIKALLQQEKIWEF